MKYNKILITLAAIFIFTACKKEWLDLEPSTAIETESSIKSLRDANYALNGIYNTLQSYEYYGARMTYYADVTGDDAQAKSNTKRCANYYMFRYNRDNAPSSLWYLPLKVTRFSNNILAQADNLPVVLETDQADINHVKGQALTLRALALFDATRVYGYPYTKDNGASLGGCIITSIPDYDYKPARNTVAECYNQVISDLTTAIPLLKNIKTPGKINKFAAMALLSRVYLYMGDNTNALLTAEATINESITAGYKLWTNAEYVAQWKVAFNNESLFEIVNTDVDNAGNEGAPYLYWKSGYDDINLTRSFYDLVNTDPLDVRRQLITTSSTRYYLMKYTGNGTTELPTASNITVLRLSEVYLIAAEAAVKLPDNTKALAYINAIVSRANPAKSITGTVTLAQVLLERRKELIGEGHRLFDAMRNNITITRTGTSHLLDLTAEEKTYNWGWYKIVLPIPKAEIDANPNIRDQQNPGYNAD
ncbi:MAG: RagB/SusD family nutrient uptake outer membrane protein [Bacteroidales bacterium]|nr:MAG: RagB/SusD family nutrient uptake outer membrane protein [Bacteroidales bacterium]